MLSASARAFFMTATHRPHRDLKGTRRAEFWKIRIDRANDPLRGPGVQAFRAEKDRGDRIDSILRKTPRGQHRPGATSLCHSTSERKAREWFPGRRCPGRTARRGCGFA